MPTGDFARRIISFGKTKVYQNAISSLIVEQEVGRFHISMHDAPTMAIVETTEETSHVFPNVWWVKMSEEQLIESVVDA